MIFLSSEQKQGKKQKVYQGFSKSNDTLYNIFSNNNLFRWMLKAPSVYSRVYISQYYNIDLKEGCSVLYGHAYHLSIMPCHPPLLNQKSSKIGKKVDNGLFPMPGPLRCYMPDNSEFERYARGLTGGTFSIRHYS